MAEAKAWQCGGKVAEFNFRGFPGASKQLWDRVCNAVGLRCSLVVSEGIYAASGVPRSQDIDAGFGVYRDRSLGLGAGKLGLKGLRRTGLKYSSGAFSYRWVAE